jgi:hypothetical protein
MVQCCFLVTLGLAVVTGAAYSPFPIAHGHARGLLASAKVGTLSPITVVHLKLDCSLPASPCCQLVGVPNQLAQQITLPANMPVKYACQIR